MTLPRNVTDLDLTTQVEDLLNFEERATLRDNLNDLDRSRRAEGGRLG